VVLAQLGKRVLLVDADLRKPRVHRVFHLSNRLGLVSFLTGSAEAETTVAVSEIAGLAVCPSGPLPPNPSELLASERMARFVEAVRKRFDYVIVDSPPVLAVSDAILPGSLSDGVVLCFRANQIHREAVRGCRDQLRMAEVKVLGAVFNRQRPTGGRGYRSYHYYESYSEASEADSAA
jgi:capsular exopolysaccharide synthesis family protein